MRGRLASLVTLTTLSLVAAGCSSNSQGSEGEILIGVPIEQTGGSAALGSAEANALRLVAEDVNREGGVLGRKIRLVIKDNKSDPVESRRLVTELLDKDKVVGIVGSGTTATTLPFLDVVEQRKVPTVSMGAGDAIVDKKKWVFKTPHNGTAIMSVLGQELAARQITKVAFLAVDNPFGNQSVAVVTQGARQGGIDVTRVERFKETEKDFSAQIGRLAETQPQAILVSAIMPYAGYAAKAIKDAKYTGRVYFDGGAGAELFVAGAGKDAEDAFMIHSSILAANQITATTPSALAQKEFFVKYTQRHSTYSGYASYAADALRIMVESIRAAGTTDSQRVRDEMEKLSYDGLTGSFQFSPSNHGGASADGLTILTVRNGGWVLAQ
jgi:branched-chain amino acid transport system substrate-binding protein